MKRMLTEYRVGPRSSVPSCGRFLCLPSQGAQDAISEAAERRCRALPSHRFPAASANSLKCCASAVFGRPVRIERLDDLKELFRLNAMFSSFDRLHAVE